MLVSCAVIIICALLYHFTRPPDPVYEGRKLSDWLKDLEPQTAGSGFIRFVELYREDDEGHEHNEAVNAVQKIGTRALPYLRLKIAKQSNFLWDNLPDFLAKRLVSLEDSTVRWQKERSELHQCLFACYILGPSAGELTPDIFESAMDGGPTVIWSVLTRVGSNAVPHLIPMLSITNEGRHGMALDFLEGIGPSASAAIPEVIRMLDTLNQDDLSSAAFTLARITDNPQKTIEPLLKLLSGTNSQIHGSIAEAMFDWDSAGKNAGPALLRLAQDTNSIARISATIALGKVAPDLATNVLHELKQIALTNTWHAYRARETLVSMGPLAKPVVDEMLNQAIIAKLDKDCNLAKAVIAIDPIKGRLLVPVLIKHLGKHAYEKEMALEALSLLGESAHAALPAITPLLNDEYLEVRKRATNALHSITSAPSAASTRATPP